MEFRCAPGGEGLGPAMYCPSYGASYGREGMGRELSFGSAGCATRQYSRRAAHDQNKVTPYNRYELIDIGTFIYFLWVEAIKNRVYLYIHLFIQSIYLLSICSPILRSICVFLIYLFFSCLSVDLVVSSPFFVKFRWLLPFSDQHQIRLPTSKWRLTTNKVTYGYWLHRWPRHWQ